MDNKTVKLKIRPAFFAPIGIRDEFENRKIHSICFGRCNYRCAFCSFDIWKVNEFPEFTLETFEQKVWELLRYSKSFKFTGGEPTLNPLLREMIEIVKVYGARVFLDTNGSNPRKVRELIDLGLIDTLGISVKGTSPQGALETARITNQKLCWENVFESISYGSKAPKVRVIVTFVACEGYFDIDDLRRIGDMLAPYGDITLKINNCYHEEFNNGRRCGLNKGELYDMVAQFVEEFPSYKGRTVLFRDHDSCVDEEQSVLF